MKKGKPSDDAHLSIVEFSLFINVGMTRMGTMILRHNSVVVAVVPENFKEM